MAEQLNMGGLSLNESQHAPQGAFERSAYVPPHLRNRPAPPGGYPPPGPAPQMGGPPPFAAQNG